VRVVLGRPIVQRQWRLHGRNPDVQLQWRHVRRGQLRKLLRDLHERTNVQRRDVHHAVLRSKLWRPSLWRGSGLRYLLRVVLVRPDVQRVGNVRSSSLYSRGVRDVRRWGIRVLHAIGGRHSDALLHYSVRNFILRPTMLVGCLLRRDYRHFGEVVLRHSR
jgi:hypothetical protein